jgi:ribulose-5-phosphate 4-epimerase/fuculose-1-phosphate aldolase
MAETDNDLRRDVALANRIIERFKLATAFGHASARIPGTNTFYISTRRSPGLADENDLLVIDTDGNVLSGNGRPNSEFWIHARIYAARPEVNGIVHAHPLACVALTQIGEPHRVVHNQGGVFVDGVPEYKDIGLIRSRELGDRVAQSLGNGVAVMMRGHGITTAFSNLRAATVAACFLEESADLQMRMLAASGGNPAKMRTFTRAEAELARDQTGPGVAAAGRAWEYYSTVAAAKPIGG